VPKAARCNIVQSLVGEIAHSLQNYFSVFLHGPARRMVERALKDGLRHLVRHRSFSTEILLNPKQELRLHAHDILMIIGHQASLSRFKEHLGQRRSSWKRSTLHG